MRNVNMILVVIAVIIIGLAGFYILGNQQAYVQSGRNQNTEVTTPLPTSESAKEVVIEVTTDGFSPSTLAVETGTKVTWINKSGRTVSINSAVHPTHLVYPPLNLGLVEDGNSASLIFNEPGTYKYHDHLNPSQTGQIEVRAS